MKVPHESLGDVLLPDFLVVGAAKSGTSSLHAYLDEHPDIQMPKIKEPWFFSFMGNPPVYTSPGLLNDLVYRLADYVKLFSGANASHKLGDASPSYLYTYSDTIKNILLVYPPEQLKKLRIVICLRDPVERAYSQFMTMKRSLNEPLNFEDAMNEEIIEERLEGRWNIFYDYRGFGCYYQQVKAFIDEFGVDRVRVFLYNDICNDPVDVCQKMYEFVGVDPDFTPDVNVRHNSVSGEPRVGWIFSALISKHGIKRAVAKLIPARIKQGIKRLVAKVLLRRDDMNRSTRQELLRWYQGDIEQLERLIGRDLGLWKDAH